jgi:hypothetical protein
MVRRVDWWLVVLLLLAVGRALVQLQSLDQRLTGGRGTATLAHGKQLAEQGAEFLHSRYESAVRATGASPTRDDAAADKHETACPAATESPTV